MPLSPPPLVEDGFQEVSASDYQVIIFMDSAGTLNHFKAFEGVDRAERGPTLHHASSREGGGGPGGGDGRLQL